MSNYAWISFRLHCDRWKVLLSWSSLLSARWGSLPFRVRGQHRARHHEDLAGRVATRVLRTTLSRAYLVRCPKKNESALIDKADGLHLPCCTWAGSARNAKVRLSYCVLNEPVCVLRWAAPAPTSRLPQHPQPQLCTAFQRVRDRSS